MNRRQLAAGVLLAAVASPAVTGGLPAAAQPAPDPAEDPPAVATIDTLSPAVPRPGDTVVLSGTVTNQGAQPLENVQVLLRYSSVALASPSQVAEVGEDPGLRYGRRDDRFFQPVAELLAPGASVRYRLDVTVDDLPLSAAGVYAVGVDVRATPPSGVRATVDTERTLLTWLGGTAPEPVPVALLWPLATGPALLTDGTLASPAPATELADGGRLDTLLSAPRGAPVSWLVDPDLLATAWAVAGGATVRAGAEGPGPGGDGTAAARDWLVRLADATAGQEVALLPFADPDLVSVAGDDPARAVAVAADAAQATADAAGQLAADLPVGRSPSPSPAPTTGPDGAVPPATYRTDLVRPTGGFTEPAAAAAYAAAGARTAVLSAEAVTPADTGPTARLDAGPTDLDAVLSDPGLGDALADLAAAPVGDRAATVSFRQRWLAETAMAALGVGRAGPPAALVAAPEQRWAPAPQLAAAVVQAWTGTDWVRPVTLAEVEEAARAGTPVPVAPVPRDAAAAAALSPEHLAGAADLVDDLERYRHLLADPGDGTAALRRAVTRALSAAWRSDPQAGADYLGRARADVQRDLGSVSVLVPESVTLSSRSGVFPLTIANDLDRAVEVRLTISPTNPDRLSVGEVPVQRVEAGEKVSVEITARAAANGRVPVTVSLATVQGEPVGTPRRTLVVATDYGAVGWFVIAGGSLLLAAAVAVRFRRERRRKAPAPEPVREEVG